MYEDEGELIRALMHAASVGVAILDDQLRHVCVNQRLASVNGLSIEAHVGRTLEEIGQFERARQARPFAERACAGEMILGQQFDHDDIQVQIDFIPLARRHVLVLIRETTDKRTAEGALSVRVQFAELISELSTLFLEVPAQRLGDCLAEALSVFGSGMGVDRVALWRFDPRRLVLTAIEEWTLAAGAKVVQGVEIFIPSTPHATRFMEGEAVSVSSLDELDPGPASSALRRSLKDLGVCAFAAVPLRIGGELRGTLDISMSKGHVWSREEVETLRLTGELFANALEREKTDRELRNRLRFEQTYARMSASLLQTSLADVEAKFCEALACIGAMLGFSRVTLAVFDEVNATPGIAQAWHEPDIAASSVHQSPVKITDLEWPVSPVLEGELVSVLDDELPPTALRVRALLEPVQELRRHMIAPLRNGQLTFGLLILQSREHLAMGEVEVTNRLRPLLDLLSSTATRLSTEANRLHAFERLKETTRAVEVERDFLREETQGDPAMRAILGQSPALRRSLEAVDAVATTNATTLLLGESGVGKELFARRVHECSLRAQGPMVKVNCATIPKELFESEFFGHMKGAFTGATKDRVGRFELAHRGTLFLDEVGEIPMDLQSKLLRVLQEGEFERVGSDRTRRVDVRVVAATNRNLALDVTAGSFRQDLYYRLSVFPIAIPPLRQRREDIVTLARHFLARSQRTLGRSGLAFTDEQLQELCNYDWPGNVRELEHVIERAVILAGTTRRLELSLDGLHRNSVAPSGAVLTDEELRALERGNLVVALEQAQWRVGGKGGAAQLLGLQPSTLRDRMRSFGIERERER